MRNVLSRMIQEMAFPDHALSRSIRKRNACTRYPLPFAPSTTDGALGRPRAPSGYRPSDRLGARWTLGLAAYDTGSGVGMLIASAQGKIRSAQAFCDFRIAR